MAFAGGGSRATNSLDNTWCTVVIFAPYLQVNSRAILLLKPQKILRPSVCSRLIAPAPTTRRRTERLQALRGRPRVWTAAGSTHGRWRRTCAGGECEVRASRRGLHAVTNLGSIALTISATFSVMDSASLSFLLPHENEIQLLPQTSRN